MLQKPFEIPQQMRNLAEKNVEQARAVYDQFMDAMTQSLTMWTKVAPSNQMTSGLSDAQDRATKFAKRNADAAFALASDLAKAKDIPEVFDIQRPVCADSNASFCRPGAGVCPTHDNSCSESSASTIIVA